MEGITTWVYRSAHASVFGPLYKYFIPFVEPHEKRDFKTRELQEILPEHNEGIYAVPQILTNRAEGFIKLAHALKAMGYEEVNLNLGCPSRTVVSKQKGAGFLAFTEELDRFLDDIYARTNMKISIKTRIGKDDPEIFGKLLDIYNQYPVEELIIHPRLQTDYYKHAPRLEAYKEAREKSRHRLCYNGDLFTASCIRDFCEAFPSENRLMIGRGLLVNPGLIKGTCTKELFREFHDRLLEGYLKRDMGDANVLCKMKELWAYQIHLFADTKPYEKKLKKVQKLSEYVQIVETLLRERDLCPPP